MPPRQRHCQFAAPNPAACRALCHRYCRRATSVVSLSASGNPSRFRQVARRQPERFPDGMLRSLQHHIRHWRALERPATEGFFPQDHAQGHRDLPAFTTIGELRVVERQHLAALSPLRNQTMARNPDGIQTNTTNALVFALAFKLIVPSNTDEMKPCTTTSDEVSSCFIRSCVSQQ